MGLFDGAMSLGTMGTGVGAIAGIAGGVFSAVTGSEDAKKMAENQKAQIANEMQQQYVKHDAMKLAIEHQSMNQMRQMQLARAMGLATTVGATGGGAVTGGSALGGVIGSISGEGNTNLTTLNQNLQTGEKQFTLNEQLSGLKMNMADIQGKAMEDSAIGKLIGGIGGSLGPMGKFAGALPGMFG